MSALTSSSTLAEIQAAYDDNASYEEDSSASKAAAFVTACRFLRRRLMRHAEQGGKAGFAQDFDPEVLKQEIADAQEWIGSHDSSGGTTSRVKHLSIGNFRI